MNIIVIFGSMLLNWISEILYMKLSIIIPVFNDESTIKNCIYSIEDQNVDFDIQIIVIDDGSTDNSVIEIKKMINKYSNIELHRQKNLKQSSARNNGLKKSDGEYIMFFDSDDVIKQDMLSTMVHAAVGNDLVVCGIEKKYSSKSIYEKSSVFSLESNTQELLQKYLTDNKEVDVGVWNKVFLKKNIVENNIQFENGDFFEDSLFVFKYLETCNARKIIYIDRSFYILCKHVGTTTTKFSPEINYYAKKYIDSVKNELSSGKYHFNRNIVNAFEIRILLHIVHHHIKYDKSWNARNQRRYFKIVNINVFFESIGFLTSKYRLGAIMARFSSSLYIYLYRRKKLG